MNPKLHNDFLHLLNEDLTPEERVALDADPTLLLLFELWFLRGHQVGVLHAVHSINPAYTEVFGVPDHRGAFPVMREAIKC